MGGEVKMGNGEEYIVLCWHCQASYNAFEVPFCSHNDPTKVCPFCLKCFCNAPAQYKTDFIRKSPKKPPAKKEKT
jgi:hypothetical protein